MRSVEAEIAHLVSTLGTKTAALHKAALAELTAKHGPSARTHILRCLIARACPEPGKKVAGDNERDREECAALLRAHFIEGLGDVAFGACLRHAVTEVTTESGAGARAGNLVQRIAQVLVLGPAQNMLLGLCLTLDDSSASTATASSNGGGGSSNGNGGSSSSSSSSIIQTAAVAHVSFCISDALAELAELSAVAPAAQAALHTAVALVASGTAARKYGLAAESERRFMAAIAKRATGEGPPLPPAVLPLLKHNMGLPLPPQQQQQPSFGAPVPSGAVLPPGAAPKLAGLLRESTPECVATPAAADKLLAEIEVTELSPAAVGAALAVMASTSSSTKGGGGAGGSTEEDKRMTLQTSMAGSSSWEAGSPVKKAAGGGDGGSVVDVPTTKASSAAGNWAVEYFVDAVCRKVPHLKWDLFVGGLDSPATGAFTPEGLGLIGRAYFHATKQPMFPTEALYRPWRNTASQLSLLRILTDPAHADHPAVKSYISAPGPRVSRIPQSPALMTNPWAKNDLVAAVVHLGTTYLHSSARTLLDHPIRVCPDVLALSLLQAVPDAMTALQADALKHLISGFLAQPDGAGLSMIARLHAERPPLVLVACIGWYRSAPDPARLARLLDATRESAALFPQLLRTDDAELAVDLALLAAQRGALNIEAWAQERISADPVAMAGTCLQRAEQGLRLKQGTGPEPFVALLRVLRDAASKGALPPDVERGLAQVMRKFAALGGGGDQQQQQDGEATSNAQQQQQQQVPSVVSSDSSSPAPVDLALSGDMNSGDSGDHTFSQETDDVANNYFGQIYNRHITIEDMIGRLAAFKASPRQKEQDVFACMLRNLFDEYRFFTQYPEPELHLTAVLFGSLVQHGLVQDASLGVALRCVLDALRKEPTGPSALLHRFGVTALGCFRQRLKEWPQYCAPICQIPHFNTLPPDLQQACRQGRDGGASPAVTVSSDSTVSGGSGGGSGGGGDGGSVDASALGALGAVPRSPSGGGAVSTSEKGPSFGSTTNIGTLLAASAGSTEFEKPPDTVEDKANIIFNNLSMDNVVKKARDLMEVVGERYEAWLAHYVVAIRASIEPNYHELYLKLVLSMPLPGLARRVLRETYRNVGVLLTSSKILNSSNNQERSLLKNLGSWLGLQTIARNKPILRRDLRLKQLLLFAYQKGPKNLLYVIPFVTKVLETCKKSRVFRLPNPWMVGMTATLKELHGLPTLKLTLKFAIEVLFINIGINIDTVQPSSVLKDMPPPAMEPASPMPSASTPTPTSASPGDEALVAAGGARMRASSFPGLVPNNVASLFPYIVVNASITLFQQQPALKQSVQLAVERAVTEILNPVVTSTVKIASMTSYKLVAKDFAIEPSERRLTNASHNVAQRLAGSLAVATAIDPLRAAIGNHLRQLLSQAVTAEQKRSQQFEPLVDQAVTLATADNLGVACVLIEQSACARAVPAVSELLADEIADRRRYTASGSQLAYVDPKAPPSDHPAVPSSLRPTFGLNDHQLALYDNYLHAGTGGSAGGSGGSVAQGASGASAAGTATGAGARAATGQSGAGATGGSAVITSPSDAARTLETLVPDLENACATLGPSQDAPPGHIVHTISRDLQAALQVVPSAQRFEAAVRVAQKLLAALWSPSANKVLTEAVVSQLQLLADGTRGALARELAKAFEYLKVEAGAKHNVELVSRLTRTRLLDAREMDRYLAGLMDQGRRYNGVLFAEELLQRCLLAPNGPPALAPADFPQTLQVLRNIASHNKPPPQTIRLLEGVAQMIKSSAAGGSGSSGGEPGSGLPGNVARRTASEEESDDPPGLREQVGFLFEDWLRLAAQPPAKAEKATVMFITRLISTMLKTDDVSTRFFRLCAGYAVELCYAQPTPETAGQPPSLVSYQAIDSFSKLVLVLLRHFGEPTKVALLKKVLATSAVALMREHDLGPTRFNQKPFFRLLSVLLQDVQSADETANLQVLAAFSTTLHKLRPAVVPGFTFSWLALVSSRHFMPLLLQNKANKAKSWQMLQLLLVDLLAYMQPSLRSARLTEAVRVLYKGTLRVLLVLVHDFPEFLCECHFALCDMIPPTCVQMRNLILSAYPRNMRLPDPLTPNLKVDLLPEITQSPVIQGNYLAALQAAGSLQQDVDHYLRTREPLAFLLDLRARLMLPDHTPEDQAAIAAAGTRYNAPAMNALVLYVGMKAIEQVKLSAKTVSHGAPLDIFQHLAVDLDTEGRYIFFNAIANHLRYPNSHTHYFSTMLLYLFAESNKEVVQEQITRVLFERVIVNRPHPWGLLITFIELIKNRAYNFWSHDFVHCDEQIEHLFENVSRSCMQGQGQRPGVEGSEGKPPSGDQAVASAR